MPFSPWSHRLSTSVGGGRSSGVNNRGNVSVNLLLMSHSKSGSEAEIFVDTSISFLALTKTNVAIRSSYANKSPMCLQAAVFADNVCSSSRMMLCQRAEECSGRIVIKSISGSIKYTYLSQLSSRL